MKCRNGFDVFLTRTNYQLKITVTIDLLLGRNFYVNRYQYFGVNNVNNELYPFSFSSVNSELDYGRDCGTPSSSETRGNFYIFDEELKAGVDYILRDSSGERRMRLDSMQKLT
ncbi:hypothetical protein [Sandarakinorhabdus sp.]|uniref:hypothetical protein n=1 Tax=Sandarakinorhabdus sp. TaxID=1916663 RepID=UPI003565F2D9